MWTVEDTCLPIQSFLMVAATLLDSLVLLILALTQMFFFSFMLVLVTYFPNIRINFIKNKNKQRAATMEFGDKE